MPSFLEEWRNSNTHRQFPLDDSASGLDASGTFRLPPSTLVDMRLDAPHESDPGEFAVTRVLVSGAMARVYVSYVESTPFVVGSFDLTPGVFGKDTGMDGAATTDLNWRGVAGTAFQGVLTEILKHPGDWTIPAANGRLNPSCVRVGPSGVRALVVDGVPLYGSIVLRPGANVRIDKTVEGGYDVLTVSSAAPAATEVIRNDQELLDALVARYGEPVRTINSISPDAVGNFSLLGADCVEVNPEGVASVRISNPCATPCCDPDALLPDVYQALSDLNARYGRLSQFKDALEANVNIMQNKLGVMHQALQKE